MLQPNINEPFNLINILSSNNWKHFAASEIINENNNGLTKNLDEFIEKKGTYIFWWTGKLEALNELNRKILLQGKKAKETYEWHAIEMQTSWLVPIEIEGQKRHALYVGKSTTLRNRIRQHFHFSVHHNDWIYKLKNCIALENSQHFLTYKPTTSCQFRSGMSLLCSENGDAEFWDILKKNCSLSILEIEENKNHHGTVTRFYLEDYLIGALRPWFNLDSER